MLFRKAKREPGGWFDPDDPGLFPQEGTLEYHDRLVAGDMAVTYYDPQGEKVDILVAEGMDRYKDLRTPFTGYLRNLVRENGLKRELGKAKVAEIEGRAKAYPYYKEKAQFKATSRIQLNQPVPIRGRPGEFWWPPKDLARRPAVRGGTAEERQAIYDAEAEQWAKWLILHGQFRELVDFVDHDSWLQGEGL